MQNEECGPELDPLLPELISIRESIRALEERKLAIEEQILTSLFGSPSGVVEEPPETSEETLAESPSLAEKLAPRLVTPADRERAAIRISGILMEALVQYFAAIEEQTLSESRKTSASLRQELEELRYNLESPTGSLATQLKQLQEELSSLQRLINGAVERLNRQAEAIRSVTEVQGRHAGALRQLVETLIRSAITSDIPPSQANTQL